MQRNVKNDMIEGARRLLATKGLQATSFAEVVAATGAPRGSIYYHFPGGKQELVLAALRLQAQRSSLAIERLRGFSTTEIAGLYLDLWRTQLLRENTAVGCPVMAVTIATDDAVLRNEAAEIFRLWRSGLQEVLQYSGLPPHLAGQFAATLVSAAEGAVLQARAARSMEMFEQTAALLVAQAKRLI